MAQFSWKHAVAILILALIWIVWGLSVTAYPALAPYVPSVIIPFGVTVLGWLGVTSPKMPPIAQMFRRLPPPGASILLGMLVALGAPALAACGSGGGLPPVPPVVIDDTACILATVAKDLEAGMTFANAATDAAAKCLAGGATAANLARVRAEVAKAKAALVDGGP